MREGEGQAREIEGEGLKRGGYVRDGGGAAAADSAKGVGGWTRWGGVYKEGG